MNASEQRDDQIDGALTLPIIYNLNHASQDIGILVPSKSLIYPTQQI